MLASFFVLFMSFAAVAAPHSGSNLSNENKILGWVKENTTSSFKKIVEAGPDGYRFLKRTSFSGSSHPSDRWSAFLTLVRIGKEKSLPEINEALESKDWFMRNAALIAMQKIKFSKAVPKAMETFKEDPSLFVRAKSLEIVALSPNDKLFATLWGQLWDDKNFYRGQGLWIRDKIVKTMSNVATRKDLKYLAKLLRSQNPEDQKLKPMVLPALRRIIGNLDGGVNAGSEQIAFWRSQLKSF